MAVNTTRWDSAEYLKTEEDVRLYLEACLEEAGDDPAFIAQALDIINRSRWGNSNGLTPPNNHMISHPEVITNEA